MLLILCIVMGQTRLGNPEVRRVVEQCVQEHLTEYLELHPDTLDSILSKSLNALKVTCSFTILVTCFLVTVFDSLCLLHQPYFVSSNLGIFILKLYMHLQTNLSSAPHLGEVQGSNPVGGVPILFSEKHRFNF